MSGKCVCGPGFVHVRVQGRGSHESAQYSDETCEEYAALLVATWKRVAGLEWSRYRERAARSKLEEAAKRYDKSPKFSGKMTHGSIVGPAPAAMSSDGAVSQATKKARVSGLGKETGAGHSAGSHKGDDRSCPAEGGGYAA